MSTYNQDYYEEDIYDDDYEETDGEPISNGGSAIRLQNRNARVVTADQSPRDFYTVTPRASRNTDPALRTAPQRTQRQAPPQRDRRVTTAPQSRFDQPVDRRGALAKLGGGGLALLGLGATLGPWAVSGLTELGTQWQQGDSRSMTFELVCGHNDGFANKTILHFTFIMDRLFMLEVPGRNFAKVDVSVTDSLSSHGIVADPSDIKLLAAAVPVDGGKFEIHTIIRWQPVGIWKTPQDTDFIFIDGGGFFRSPVTAPKKK